MGSGSHAGRNRAAPLAAILLFAGAAALAYVAVRALLGIGILHSFMTRSGGTPEPSLAAPTPR